MQPYSNSYQNVVTDFSGYPSSLPYSFQNPTNYSNNYGQYQYKKYQNHQQYQPKRQLNSSLDYQRNQNKNVHSDFDANQSMLLNQNKSYARNITGRLLNQADQSGDRKKQQELQRYREQLRLQIQQTKKRKKAQDDKIKKQEADRQRKFYEQFKIKAQVKDNKQQKSTNNDKGYFMARTLHKIKKSQSEVKQQQVPKHIQKVVIKARGKGYLNKSSLDNYDVPPPVIQKVTATIEGNPQNAQFKFPIFQIRKSAVQEQLIRERVIEEQRISNLLLFQRRLLQKISDIKVEIRNNYVDFDSQKELLRIKNTLKSIPMPASGNSQTDFFSQTRRNNQFYSLPKRSIKLPSVTPNTRFSINLNDNKKSISSAESPQRKVKNLQKQEFQVKNDKNFAVATHVQKSEQIEEQNDEQQ